MCGLFNLGWFDFTSNPLGRSQCPFEHDCLFNAGHAHEK